MKDTLMNHPNDLLSHYLKDRIILPDSIPRIILAVAPCRSGTTPLLRVFAESGIQAWYQPIKALLRSKQWNIESTFPIPSLPQIFIKETLGPYTEQEALINPLEALLLAGVPIEKIDLVLMARDPYTCLTAWIEQFSFHTPAENLINNAVLAYQNLLNIESLAQNKGIRTSYFYYESLKDYQSNQVIFKTLNQMQVEPGSQVFSDWKTLPHAGTPESNIVLPYEPALYNSQPFHKQFENSSKLTFYKKGKKAMNTLLSPAFKSKIQASNLTDIYSHIAMKARLQLDH